MEQKREALVRVWFPAAMRLHLFLADTQVRGSHYPASSRLSEDKLPKSAYTSGCASMISCSLARNHSETITTNHLARAPPWMWATNNGWSLAPETSVERRLQWQCMMPPSGPLLMELHQTYQLS